MFRNILHFILHIMHIILHILARLSEYRPLQWSTAPADKQIRLLGLYPIQQYYNSDVVNTSTQYVVMMLSSFKAYFAVHFQTCNHTACWCFSSSVRQVRPIKAFPSGSFSPISCNSLSGSLYLEPKFHVSSFLKKGRPHLVILLAYGSSTSDSLKFAKLMLMMTRNFLGSRIKDVLSALNPQ